MLLFYYHCFDGQILSMPLLSKARLDYWLGGSYIFHINYFTYVYVIPFSLIHNHYDSFILTSILLEDVIMFYISLTL
jgi:hypothetical protein